MIKICDNIRSQNICDQATSPVKAFVLNSLLLINITTVLIFVLSFYTYSNNNATSSALLINTNIGLRIVQQCQQYNIFLRNYKHITPLQMQKRLIVDDDNSDDDDNDELLCHCIRISFLFLQQQQQKQRQKRFYIRLQQQRRRRRRASLPLHSHQLSLLTATATATAVARL